MGPASDSVDCRLLEHDLLSIIAPYLDTTGVAGLICAGNCSVEALRQVLAVPRLLINAARQAGSKDIESSIGIPASTLSAWLEQFPVPDINLYSEDLVHIPNFPLPLAASLVGYGLRITHQQVLSALHAKVPGVLVWVQAYEQLNLPPPPGMHPLAVALCCGQDLQQLLLAHQGITEADTQGILHFAIAMPRDGNATASLGVLCELHAAQALNLDVCEGLIRDAIQVGASERVHQLIDKLPAVQQLSQDSIIDLLQTAAHARLSYTVRRLCSLPAARAATPAAVLELLQIGVRSEAAGTVNALCELAAAQQLTANQIAGLLHAAVQTKDSHKVSVLLGLPGAQTIPAATVADLIASALAAAAEAGPCYQKVTALCSLAVAQCIDSRTLQGLLQAAVDRQPPDQEATVVLCTLPAAQSQDAASVSRLLRKAVAAGGHRKVSALLQIPSSRGIGRQDVLQLLHAVAASSDSEIMAALLGAYRRQCAAADQQDILQLLHAAATNSASDITTVLLESFFEQYQAAGTVITYIVQAAGRAGMWHNVSQLCSLCAETALDADAIAQLLSAALEAADGSASANGNSKEAISVLLKLPAAQLLSVEQYTPLLHTAAARQPLDQPDQCVQWLELTAAILQANAAATAALDPEVLLQIVTDSLAIYSTQGFWVIDVDSWHRWRLDGIVLGEHSLRLLHALDTASLQSVTFQAAGILASKPAAAAAAEAPQTLNTAYVSDGGVSIYADTIMAIATAIAARQLPGTQLLELEALLAKLLDAVTHVWNSKHPGSRQGWRMVGDTSYPTQVVYAQITVKLLNFVSKQGYSLRPLVSSEGGAAAIIHVGAGLQKAMDLVMNQQCQGCDAGSEQQPGTAAAAGGSTAATPEASTWAGDSVSTEQWTALTEVLEQGVTKLVLED